MSTTSTAPPHASTPTMAVLTKLLVNGGTILFWYHIQSIITSTVLECMYGMPLKGLRLRRVQPGTLAYSSHRALAYIISAIGLFAYRAASELSTIPPSMYAVLHVSPYAQEADIRKSYRHLARIYHPDKVGPAYEHVFMVIHEAYSTLVDPVLRYAYDRFGHQVIHWENASSVHDYMAIGMETFIYAQISIAGIHAVNWLFSRKDARHFFGLGTYVSDR